MKTFEDLKSDTIQFVMIDMLALPFKKQGEDDYSWYARLSVKDKTSLYLLSEFEAFSQNPAGYLGKDAKYDNQALIDGVKAISHINAAHEGKDVFMGALARYSAFTAMIDFFDVAKARLKDPNAPENPFISPKQSIQIDILELELKSNRASYCSIVEGYDGKPTLQDFKREFVARSFQRQTLPKMKY